jgi:predicted PurR-regulated permease PerM
MERADDSPRAGVARGALSPIQRSLITAAAVVVLLWGIRAASEILTPFLLAMVLAFSVAPVPNWFVRRFKFHKAAAILLTLAVVLAVGFSGLLAVEQAATRIKARLPTYHDRFAVVHDQAFSLLESQGLDSTGFSPARMLSPERVIALTTQFIHFLRGVLSEGLIVLLLFSVLLVEMVEGGARGRSRFAAAFESYGKDIQRYMAITAETGAINAAANLLLLLLLGVDFPVLWCILYFFLNFIPTLGFLLALVPPALLALLMHGWHTALAVAIGLIVTNTVVDNVVKPLFMKKGMDVSFLNVVLSFVVWTFLLGSVGAILAIPLTMATWKFIQQRIEAEHRLGPVERECPG